MIGNHPGAADHVAEHRHLRIVCTDCGPNQMIIYEHECTDERMTGSTHILVSRCGNCGQVVTSATPTYAAEYSSWPREGEV